MNNQATINQTTVKSELSPALALLSQYQGEQNNIGTGNSQKSNNITDSYPSLAEKKIGFLHLLMPRIAPEIHQLEQCISQAATQLPDNALHTNNIVNDLIASLFGRLRPIITRPLILEMNVLKLQGELKGNDKSERYDNFLLKLQTPDYAAQIFAEYKELDRCTTVAISQWRAFYQELINRIETDWFELIELKQSKPQKAVTLCHIECNSGDTHNDGRAVAILAFNDSEKVVYKPRSLKLDACFNQLILWQNQHNRHCQLATFNVVDKGDYGWSEFVEHASMDNPEDAALYYRRFGALAALMYGLGATDIHFENVVAKGAFPVVIDLETLFEPATSNSFPYTVLSTAILPLRMWVSKDKDGVDLGGISAKEGDVVDANSYGLVNKNTDEMAWQRVKTKIQNGKNQPVYDKEKLSFENHIDQIISGFEQYLAFLSVNREQLLSQLNPLTQLMAQPMRYIVQATHLYEQILYASYHPDLMRSQSLRQEFIENNLRRYIDHHDTVEQRIDAETASLANNNIPIFHCLPESKALYSNEIVVEPVYFSHSGQENLIARFDSLDEKQTTFQRFLLTLSLTQSFPDLSGPHVDGLRPNCPDESFGSNFERCIAGAKSIGDTLCNTALESEDTVNWLGYYQAPSSWSLREMEENIYDGRTGMLLFLAHLGYISGERKYNQMAQKTFKSIAERLPQSDLLNEVGFSGLAGYLYTLSQLKNLWPEDAKVDQQINATMALLAPKIAQDKSHDFMAGNAGALLALLSLAENPIYQRQATELAIKTGDLLLANFVDTDETVGWPHPDHDKVLTGFSHGSGGIAFALAELSKVTGDQRFLSAAQKSIAFENRYYKEAEQNWPDKRATCCDVFQSTWCHGAAGLTLSRVLAAQIQEPAQRQRDIAACAYHLSKPDTMTNHSLCHGTLGNLDIFHTLVTHHPDEQLRGIFNSKLNEILNDISKRGFVSATPDNQMQANLMTGLAGMGLVLLRMVHPDKIPNVLAMTNRQA